MAKTQQAVASVALPFPADVALKRCGVAAQSIGQIIAARPNLGQFKFIAGISKHKRTFDAQITVNVRSDTPHSSTVHCEASAKEGIFSAGSAQRVIERFLDALDDCDAAEVERFEFPSKSAPRDSKNRPLVIALILGAVLLIWIGSNKQNNPEVPQPDAPTTSEQSEEDGHDVSEADGATSVATVQITCPPEAQATGQSYRVRGSNINIRSGPGIMFDRIVNQKATSILGSTQFSLIDSSTIVFEECRQGDWSRIYVVEPEWLRESHRGWVANQFLISDEEFASTGFVEADLCLDEVTRPYKDIIVAGLNKIAAEDSRCQNSLDPCSAYLSGSKGTPDAPVFYVTCGKDLDVVNVFFSEADLQTDVRLSAPTYIDHASAVSLCKSYAQSSANFPSTVDFSWLLDLSVADHPNGRTTVLSSFSAQNAFGVEQSFNIRCLFDSGGLIEADIQEKR